MFTLRSMNTLSLSMLSIISMDNISSTSFELLSWLGKEAYRIQLNYQDYNFRFSKILNCKIDVFNYFSLNK